MTISTNCMMYLSIPKSRSEKIMPLLEKYCDYSTTLLPDKFCEGLDDFHTIAHLKGADYHIERDGEIYDRFSDGHHCYYIKYQGQGKDINNLDLSPCYECYHGRASLGCVHIPICDSCATWDGTIQDYVNFIGSKKEIFWFSLGHIEKDKWIINKTALHAIVDYQLDRLLCCPLFNPEQIHKNISELPDYIFLKDPDYNFIKISKDSVPKISNNYSHLLQSPTHLVLKNSNNFKQFRLTENNSHI